MSCAEYDDLISVRLTLYNRDNRGNPITIKAERCYREDGSYLETRYTYNTNGDVLTTTYPGHHVVGNEYGTAYEGNMSLAPTASPAPPVRNQSKDVNVLCAKDSR